MKKQTALPYYFGCKVTNPNDCYYFGCMGVQENCARLRSIYPENKPIQEEK